MDDFTSNMIQQQPFVELLHAYMRQQPVAKDTVQNELANKPRYDLTGERYGNTLTDDMIYMKNPRTTTEDMRDKHTPESYEYFAQPKGNAGVPEATFEAPSLPQVPDINPRIFPWNRMDERRPVGRKKNVTEGNDWWTEAGAYDLSEIPELNSYFEALQRMAQVEQLGTDSARQEKFGRVPTNQVESEANYDYYTGTPVNYDRLSGAQLTQLAKMGVDRPIESENDASADLMGLVDLYRRVLGLR